MQIGRRATLTAVLCGLLLVGAVTNLDAAPYVVFPHNDSGMHCMDNDFSVWAILPPGNFLKAQVVKTGDHPQILTNVRTRVTYRAVADPTGSINTTSIGKTNFWTYVTRLYGFVLAPDMGFLGQKMPGAANARQPFLRFNPSPKEFVAGSIPITQLDNERHTNPYPLFLVEAFSGNTLLAGNTAVPNVAVEMHCDRCHATGEVAATDRGVTWSTNPNLNLQMRENVLKLHDSNEGTSLFVSRPVVCADCHYSAATDILIHGSVTSPLRNSKTLSTAMHLKHGAPSSNPPVGGNGIAACYQCHPGQNTQCYRDPMFASNIACQSCHGGLQALSGVFPLKSTGQPRRPWFDLPQCQSCHTGDARNHLGDSIILRQAYDPGDPSATPRLATNRRFAENPGKNFKESQRHHGLSCETCHGSPHAIWQTNQANDNLQAIRTQGHSGQIVECRVCHLDTLPATIYGPHGIHNVNSATWIEGHPGFFESRPNRCKSCHGLMLEGTAISRAQADRTFSVEGTTVTIPKGGPVSCSLCHENPLMGGESTGRTGRGGESTGETGRGGESTGRTGMGRETTGRTGMGGETTGNTRR
ncbi:MAG: hypothetical protein WAW37_07175 [Syntrophobacteraceae bacterium]